MLGSHTTSGYAVFDVPCRSLIVAKFESHRTGSPPLCCIGKFLLTDASASVTSANLKVHRPRGPLLRLERDHLASEIRYL